MADRIIKGDSGNDVVIQNNAGSRKIEVTNSGDVEITGDVKTTTVKATNLKANDGTAGLVVADSTGEVTSSGGLKATNIKTTNLKANDGTASLEIADSTGDIGFSGNTNLKIKLPSAGGIYESDGSTQVITESGGAVTIQNATFSGTVSSSATISTQDYFVARLSGDQTVADDTLSIISFVETADPQGWFDSYKFTPQKAGKYFIYVSGNAYNATNVSRNQIYYFAISKNSDASGTSGIIAKANNDSRNTYFYSFGSSSTAIVDFNGSSDYVYALFYPNNGGLYTDNNIIQSAFSEFGGFRIGP